MSAFDEVCKNTKNKRKVRNYKEYKCVYISRIYNILNERRYVVGKYNVFTIYEPKERRIVSQGLQDKIINHLVSRYILYPSLLPCLIPSNVASIVGKGTKAGIYYKKEFEKICKIKYGDYYILKCDVSKFFASIDKEILKQKVARKIKDKEALEIVNKIIDSEESGLGIGNMTSQVLAVFYLNDLDHYIKEELHIKYYVRYQDYFLLFHQSKDYLKYCLEKIKEFLAKEKLRLNNKSRIYRSSNNYVFLGRTKNGRYAKYRNIKRKIKYKRFLYENNCLELANLVNSMRCYENLVKKI